MKLMFPSLTRTLVSCTLLTAAPFITHAQQPFIGVTGYTLQSEYQFGTAAGNNVQSITDLRADFRPDAPWGRINGELQHYNNFLTTTYAGRAPDPVATVDRTHQFEAEALVLNSNYLGGGYTWGHIESGAIVSNETVYRPVIVEVLAQIPHGRAHWPAIWLYDLWSGDNNADEIDIMESVFNGNGDTRNHVFQYCHGNCTTVTNYMMNANGRYDAGADLSLGYHYFTTHWHANGDCDMYVDGVRTIRRNIPWIAAAGEGGHPPNIQINQAITATGTNWPGPIVDNSGNGTDTFTPDLNSMFKVRHIRIFKPSVAGGWSMEEASGTTTADFSGNNITGTLTGSPAWTSGVVGNALSFNGTNHVRMNNGSVTGPLKPALPVTVAAWVKINSASDSKIFASDQFDATKYAGYDLGLASSKICCDYGDNGAPGAASRRTKVGTTILAAGQWYHLAAVIRGPTDMSLYVNGVDDGGTYSGTGSAVAYTTAPSKIGAGGTSGFFNGSIDEVLVYNRALSSSEIGTLALLVDEHFNDGGVSNGSDPLDLGWTVLGSGPVTLSAGPFNTAGNTSTGLIWNASNAYSVAKGGAFSTRTLSTGSAITLSFDFRAVGTIPSVASGWRFALGSSTDTFALLFGTGTSPSATFAVYPVDTISGTNTVLTTTGTPLAMNDNTIHKFSLTLNRTATNTLSLTATIDQSTFTASQTGVTNFTFNRIILGEGNLTMDFNVDNVVIR